MRLVVDHDVRLPAMFALTFRDPHELDGTGILKQLGVALGDDVIVSIALNAATTQLMQGEVTSSRSRSRRPARTSSCAATTRRTGCTAGARRAAGSD